jgi:hypothetical protein
MNDEKDPKHHLQDPKSDVHPPPTNPVAHSIYSGTNRFRESQRYTAERE